MSASVAQLMQEHPYLKLLPSNRIKCEVTGHELPLKPDVIASHVNGKRFKKALEWYNYDYSEFLPYVVPHKHDSKKLFCLLTKQELNKVPEEVKNHVQGKRFSRLKKEKEEKDSKRKVKSVAEDDEEPDFWMPESEEEEERDGDREGDEESVEDSEDDGDEFDVASSEDEDDLAGKKRKKGAELSKARKIVKVDEDFKIIQKIDQKGKAKGKK